MRINKKIKQEYKSNASGIMQFPCELENFMRFMIVNNVKSYLEIGVKGGSLVKFIKNTLNLDNIYACDINNIEPLVLDTDVNFYHGSSRSDGYMKWRESLGHIDMVFIDGEHTYKAIKKDYQIEQKFSHSFIAFHDICNKGYSDLRKFWLEEVHGEKTEFVNCNPRSRLICLAHKNKEYMKKYKRKYGTSCGIGVCWNSP